MADRARQLAEIAAASANGDHVAAIALLVASIGSAISQRPADEQDALVGAVRAAIDDLHRVLATSAARRERRVARA